MTTNSREYAHNYYLANKDKYRAAAKKFREKKKREKLASNPNPRLFDMREDFKTTTKEKFQAIPKKELTYSQKYYAENRERIREQQRLSRKRKKINARQREYYAKNREHICELQRKSRYEKKRREKLSKSFLWRLRLKIFW